MLTPFRLSSIKNLDAGDHPEAWRRMRATNCAPSSRAVGPGHRGGSRRIKEIEQKAN